MPRVTYTPGAERELYALPRSTFDAFQRAFDALERDPLDPGPPFRMKVLREPKGRRVIRFGVWGAIYRIEGDQVRILKVGPRSTLYQGR